MSSAQTEVRPTFEVDKEGLRKLLADRGPAFAIFELVQNAWDEDITRVDVDLQPTSIEGVVTLTVEDDNPEGFKDLAHAYTLFAESAKKNQAEKRGRFNLGEKLVIASCIEARIVTTKGTILFTDQGREHHPGKMPKGTRFQGTLRMTEEEYDLALAAVERLIPPAGIVTTFNGESLTVREPVRTFEASLATVLAGDEGELRRTYRKTPVSLYEPSEGEAPYLYEMGIPVVELEGDRWHVDVGQKVELNMNRDNVPPAYRRALRARVLEGAGDLLTDDDGEGTWLVEALTDPKITKEGADAALTARFTKRRVSFDPSDREANAIAVSQGLRVVHSRDLPKPARAIIKQHPELLLPAGQVTPSPKPYNPGEANTRSVLPEAKWTDGIKAHVAFAQAVAKQILDGADIKVEIVNDQECRNFHATYGREFGSGNRGKLEYNLLTLGRKWFEESPLHPDHLSLLIHEFGHHFESDHLSRDYYRALTDTGARMVALALRDSGLFEAFEDPALAATL